MREWLARLIDWLRRDRLDRELTEELTFHRALLERDAAADGAAASEAPYIARRRLGNVTSVREMARERWSIPPLEQFQQDLRYAIRGLRRSPGFTATVVITLALGIGANAAMFSVVDRLMFRPLAHLREPATVRRIYWQWLERGNIRTTLSTEYTRYLDMQRWTNSFSQFAGFSERNLAVGSGQSARERRVGVVSASYFDFFDARPALGRFFVASEDVIPRGADVAVLSYGFWQTEFGGRDVRGTVLQVGEVRATVIGVAPEAFSGVDDANPPSVYIPITTWAGSGRVSDSRTYFSKYFWSWMHIMVRLKPGVSTERAEADATQAFRRSWIVEAVDDPFLPAMASVNPRVVVSSLRPGGGPSPALEARTALWVSIVAAIVLLIACANVANLYLARTLRRQRETALRIALGVSRGRLIIQSVTEALILALAGGVAALFVAQWAGAAVQRMLLTTSASGMLFTDWRTLRVTFGLAILTGLLVGMVSVLGSSRVGDLARTLRAGARGVVAEGARIRGLLLVVQATLSVVLLIGAGLFVRSLNAVTSMPMGYEPDRVLLVNRVLRGSVYNDSAQVEMRRVLLSTAQSIPGVESAAWMSSAPFVSTSASALFVPGVDSVGRFGEFSYQATTPDYFRTMGTRILRGRGLTSDDRRGGPDVAVISESMARVLWPRQNAIGQCFRVRSDTVPCTTVVGIAEDMVQRDIAGTKRFHYYLSIDQFTRTWGNGMLLRLKGEPARQAESIRAILQRAMTGTSYVTVQPLSDIVSNAQRSWRLGATMFVAFAVLALVVAAVGLYGVIGYSVAQRMHELGVRVALGAQRRDILRLVVGQSIQFAVAGVILGVLAAAVPSRWIQPLLFHQSARDPLIYGVVAATMVVVALGASAVPALRAANADPNAALRSE